MKSLNDKIEELTQEIEDLRNQLAMITEQVDSKTNSVSFGSTFDNTRYLSSINPNASLAFRGGAPIFWNNSDASYIGIGTKSTVTPTEGYNKHSHSRYAGGALDANTLEIVEYDVDWATSADYDKHSQYPWSPIPPIKTQTNSAGEAVSMIGGLNLNFNPNSQKWGVESGEIDVAQCLLVLRGADGNIMNDSGSAPMESYLYKTKLIGALDDNGDPIVDANGNNTKEAVQDTSLSSVIWDEIGKVWRFLAVYAED